MAIDRIFSLYELLSGGVDVAGKGKGQVGTDLLDDSDARRGVADGTDEVRVNADGSGAEETLDTIGDGCVQRAAQQHLSRGIVSGLLLLLLHVDGLLFRGLPLREQ